MFLGTTPVLPWVVIVSADFIIPIDWRFIVIGGWLPQSMRSFASGWLPRVGGICTLTSVTGWVANMRLVYIRVAQYLLSVGVMMLLLLWLLFGVMEVCPVQLGAVWGSKECLRGVPFPLLFTLGWLWGSGALFLLYWPMIWLGFLIGPGGEVRCLLLWEELVFLVAPVRRLLIWRNFSELIGPGGFAGWYVIVDCSS
jgi:hypothetical protein